MDELDEMIAVLEGIQKHRREISLLIQRAKTMCPVLMHWKDNWTNERVRQLLEYEVIGNQFDVDKKIAEQIQEYKGRKAKLQIVEGQTSE